ncbi:hypothetical protein [Roseateles sp.]|uniref:hypothetical protein n=1 Tax=Roseateles sp. TaxID=1971397 RepID=UPI00395B8560
MAEKIVQGTPSEPAEDSTGLSPALAAARAMALRYAGFEISALASVLRREVDSDDFPYMAKHALSRIEELGTVVGTLHEQDREVDIRENYRVVFDEALPA